MRIAIFGATGALGREVVAALADASDDPALREPPLLFAGARSAGETLPWRDADEDLPVESFTDDAVRGVGLALLALPPDAARSLAPRLRALGVRVLDASRAHRGEAPLWSPAASSRGPFVALPGPEAVCLARALVPFTAEHPVRLRVVALRAASRAGNAGVAELGESTARLLNGQEPEPGRFPHRLAFNLVPQAGAFAGSDTQDELDFASDLAALLPHRVRAATTIAWGPWFFGDAMFVSAAFESPLEPASARARLAGVAGVKLVDRPEETVYPLPSLAAGDEAVLVGRLRADAAEPGALSFLLAFDAIRVAAAQAVRALRALAGGLQ